MAFSYLSYVHKMKPIEAKNSAQFRNRSTVNTVATQPLVQKSMHKKSKNEVMPSRILTVDFSWPPICRTDNHFFNLARQILYSEST